MTDKLIARRKGHRREAQKLCDSLTEMLASDELNWEQIRCQKSELVKQYQKITSLDDEIQDSIPLDSIEADVSNVSEWSMTIDSAIYKAEQALKDTQEDQTVVRGVRNVKLPTIELPKFDGSYLAWQNFWDLFETAVHKRTDLGNAAKFHYLVSQLTGEAANLMIGFNYTDAEYDEAVILLKRTYGNTSYLIDAHLNAIIDLKPPGPTGMELSSFRSSYEGHLRALKSLKSDVESAGFVFATLLLRKLPSVVRDNMNREGRKDNWDLNSLRRAIEIEIGHLKATEPANFAEAIAPRAENFTSDGFSRHRESTILSTSATPPVTNRHCYFCQSPNHKVFQCDLYDTTEKRQDQAKKLRLCFNCLRGGHSSKDCKSTTNCRICRRRHHTTLCRSTSRRGSRTDGESSQQAKGTRRHDNISQHSISVEHENGSVNHSNVNEGEWSSSVMLPTAITSVGDRDGKKVDHIRVLLDIGSQRTFVVRDLVNSNNFKIVRNIKLAISGFCSEMKCDTYDVVELNVFVGNEVITLEAVVVNSLPDKIHMPGRSRVIKNLVNQGFPLADTDLCNDILAISILIGADQYSKFVYSQTVDDVTLIPSKFGTLISGPIKDSNNYNNEKVFVENVTVLKVACQTDCLHDNLEKFWKLDNVCETETDDFENFEACVRFENDHFVASLPWKPNHPELPINYNLCKRRLNSLIKSLNKTPELLNNYNWVIRDQIQNNFIEPVRVNDLVTGRLHYIPHHCVVKPSSTTPVRIVFDCSAKSKPELPSLNDCLYSGPVLLNEMLAILLRFRAFKYACVSDIMKAFLMVELEEDDRNVTRFLWPEDPSDPNSKIVAYRFRVVLFGATCSQFLLNMSIKVHLKQFNNPLVRDIERSLYVDNILYSMTESDQLVEFYKVASSILNKANFKLRSWASNCESLNNLVPDDLKCSKMKNCREIDVLGLLWDSPSDKLNFNCHNIDVGFDAVTKRFILSECSKIYDPLGILLPVTIASRILLQELWRIKSGWDEPVDDRVLTRWKLLAQQLNECQNLSIPRSLSLIFGRNLLFL